MLPYELQVFEAVSSGAVFVSEHFEELERLFGDRLLYVKKDGDTRKQLSLLSSISRDRYTLADRLAL